MFDAAATRTAILDQCARYPALTARDLLKFLHQSTFGCGHLVESGSGLDALITEAAACSPRAGAEPLDGDFCRVHLGTLSQGLSPETLWRAFFLSAQSPCGTAEELEGRIAVLLSLAQEGLLPCSVQDLTDAVSLWRAARFPMQRHSEAFRAAYAPAYRVVHRRFGELLPLLIAIDRKMAAGKPMLLALEGGSAAGKTTAAGVLRTLYDCPVLHMDDFFLRPAQRTAERLAQPGGNVDRERFSEEVLQPLRAGKTAAYRRYDCHSQTLLPPVEIAPAPLMVVEGAYSCHPELRDAYDLTAFLRISPDLQRRRIHTRNTPDLQKRFFEEWIPMEQRYFDAFAIPSHCDLILEAAT